MWSFPWAKCTVIFQLAILTHHYPTVRKNGISEARDCYEDAQERIQVWELHPENSVEEYEFHCESEDLTLEMSFCTRLKVATLVELQNIASKQTVSVQILDGLFQISVEEFETWKPGCAWAFSEKPVNDGTLHKIKLKITPDLLSMQHYHVYNLVGNESSSNYSHCISNGTLSKLHHLVLGGEIVDRDPFSKIEVLYNFAGCLRNLRLNGVDIGNVSEKLTSQDVTPGCPEFSPSCTQVCPPSSEYRNGFCVCPEGTKMGPDDICSPTCSCTECKNGGTCYTSSTGPYCACNSGFFGSHCEISLDPCIDILCNNGSCVRDNDTSFFTCICHPGFKGKFCNETDMSVFRTFHNGIWYETLKKYYIWSIPITAVIGVPLLICLFKHTCKGSSSEIEGQKTDTRERVDFSAVAENNDRSCDNRLYFRNTNSSRRTVHISVVKRRRLRKAEEPLQLTQSEYAVINHNPSDSIFCDAKNELEKSTGCDEPESHQKEINMLDVPSSTSSKVHEEPVSLKGSIESISTTSSQARSDENESVETDYSESGGRCSDKQEVEESNSVKSDQGSSDKKV